MRTDGSSLSAEKTLNTRLHTREARPIATSAEIGHQPRPTIPIFPLRGRRGEKIAFAAALLIPARTLRVKIVGPKKYLGSKTSADCSALYAMGA
jgi:hypothetical protein